MALLERELPASLHPAPRFALVALIFLAKRALQVAFLASDYHAIDDEKDASELDKGPRVCVMIANSASRRAPFRDIRDCA